MLVESHMPDNVATLAIRHLRAHHGATLLVDGIPTTIRTVIDGQRRAIVAPVPAGTLQGEEIVLAIPEEHPEVGEWLSAMVDVGAIEPDRETSCDRWRAYHGSPKFASWARMTIESARFGSAVLDGGELDLMNPFLPREAELLRTLNHDRAMLRAVVQRVCGVVVLDALAVGIDPDGFDVRSSSTVLPLRVPMEPSTGDDALDRVRTMLEGRK
jgi:hypothetical protein